MEVVSPYSIGAHLKLKTIFGEELGGEVYSFDKASETVILRTPGSTPFHHNVRILRCSCIESIIDSVPADLAHGEEPLPMVDMQRCQEREAKALRTAELEAAKIGIGVSREAQDIFDALAKTLPCRWDSKDIIVLGEITISPPYAPENLTTTHPEDILALNRVKKVLVAERGRLGHT